MKKAILVAFVVGVCFTLAQAELVPAGLPVVVSEAFTGYGLPAVPNTYVIDGPALVGDNGGVGFSGAWAGSTAFVTDHAFTRDYPGQPTVLLPSPISGDPAAAIGGGTGQVTRPFAAPIAKPVGAELSEFYMTGASITTSTYKPAWFQLLDNSGNLLFAFGSKGAIGIDGNTNKQMGITGFDAGGVQRFATTGISQDSFHWTTWVLYGNWASDGTLDLQLFVNPTATDLADTDRAGALTGSGIDARLSCVVNSNLSGLGLMTNRGGDNAFLDDFSIQIPEPATMTLLALGVAGLLRRRK
jgi:hypothetical protein